jgi:hypothetical protein
MEAGGDRREPLAVRVELDGVAVPQFISALPTAHVCPELPPLALSYSGARLVTIDMTRSVPSKALDTCVRKLSCIFCVDVRMAGTGNDHRLDAQVTPRRRLLPLWPNLVVS